MGSIIVFPLLCHSTASIRALILSILSLTSLQQWHQFCMFGILHCFPFSCSLFLPLYNGLHVTACALHHRCTYCCFVLQTVLKDCKVFVFHWSVSISVCQNINNRTKGLWDEYDQFMAIMMKTNDKQQTIWWVITKSVRDSVLDMSNNSTDSQWASQKLVIKN